MYRLNSLTLFMICFVVMPASTHARSPAGQPGFGSTTQFRAQ